jgi:DNA polymerase III epsilon subunit-like protein
VRVCALHVLGGDVLERFSATVNPQARIPRYVAERAGLEVEALEGLPTFDAILDDLVRFLGERPICAQEAHQTWAFLEGEARRAGRTLLAPALVDINQLAGGSGNRRSVWSRRLGIGFAHRARGRGSARHQPRGAAPVGGRRGCCEGDDGALRRARRPASCPA